MDDHEYRMHMAGVVSDGFALDPPGYERLSAWTHILMHLVNARANFERVIDDPFQLGDLKSALQQHAFFVAGIMAYCRCYASTGSAIPKLDPKQVFSGSSDGLQIHSRLVYLRNTLAAHTDQNDLLRITLAVKEETDRIVVRHLLTSAMPVPEISQFIEAVAHTERYVTVRLNKQLDKMSTRFGKTITID